MPSGITGDYHRIVSVYWDADQGAQVRVALYLSKEDRDAGRAPMEVKAFSFRKGEDLEGNESNPFPDADLESNYLLEYCYGKLKEDSYFAGAIDA